MASPPPTECAAVAMAFAVQPTAIPATADAAASVAVAAAVDAVAAVVVGIAAAVVAVAGAGAVGSFARLVADLSTMAYI